jgi:hypothetical protein
MHLKILCTTYSPLSALGRFSVSWADGRTAWTGDQPVARPLHAQTEQHKQNKHKHNHSSSGIRTHDPSIWADEESSCLRTHNHCGRQFCLLLFELRRTEERNMCSGLM